MLKGNVLVVDDEVSIRDTLDEFLTGEGYNVDLAENGDRALEMFGKSEYDLVFMDIHMPGINGIEALREMKRSRPKTKVIVISGLPDEHAFEQAMTVSEEIIEAFIPKPFKPADLRNVLHNVKRGLVVPSFGLSEVQQRALLDISSTAVEDAASAFGRIAEREIEIVVESVNVSPLGYTIGSAKDTEELVGLCFECTGQIEGMILILFSKESGLRMVDILEHKQLGTTQAFDDEPDVDVTLKAAANVLTVSYAAAIKKHLGLSVSVSFSRSLSDNASALLESVSVEYGEMGRHLFNIKSRFAVVGANIAGSILLLTDMDSLATFFEGTEAKGF